MYSTAGIPSFGMLTIESIEAQQHRALARIHADGWLEIRLESMAYAYGMGADQVASLRELVNRHPYPDVVLDVIEACLHTERIERLTRTWQDISLFAAAMFGTGNSEPRDYHDGLRVPYWRRVGGRRHG